MEQESVCITVVHTVGTEEVHHHRGTRGEVQVHHEKDSRQTWQNTTLSRMRRSRMTAHSRVHATPVCEIDACGIGAQRASGARPDGTKRSPGTCRRQKTPPRTSQLRTSSHVPEAQDEQPRETRSEATGQSPGGLQDNTQSQMQPDTRHAGSQAAASSAQDVPDELVDSVDVNLPMNMDEGVQRSSKQGSWPEMQEAACGWRTPSQRGDVTTLSH